MPAIYLSGPDDGTGDWRIVTLHTHLVGHGLVVLHLLEQHKHQPSHRAMSANAYIQNLILGTVREI